MRDRIKVKGVLCMSEDLASYVYDKMLAEAKNYQWRMVHDSHKQALEIYFVVSLEAEEAKYVQDVNGNVNRSELLQFEHVACFYNEKENRIVPSNYLYAVPFNPEEGIEKGTIDAYLKQQHILISGVRSQLREFLLDDQQKEFTMEWNEMYVADTINTMKKTNRYAIKKLPFASEEDQSLVEQFKEDQYDGLERI